MGGFQKYPIPRYLSVGQWVVNRQWKTNSFHILVPSAILIYLTWRNIMISSYTPPKFGEYVDPQSAVAPKAIKY